MPVTLVMSGPQKVRISLAVSCWGKEETRSRCLQRGRVSPGIGHTVLTGSQPTLPRDWIPDNEGPGWGQNHTWTRPLWLCTPLDLCLKPEPCVRTLKMDIRGTSLFIPFLNVTLVD